ncbi:hypothetical protein [Riemerella anatipestifer]|uniref:hypothetical protein n=1 Tax=Riemerella anatipestifer TaxID=34085 RepID=UPI00129E5023|nr:hypothetical protein [Riemerella anatipestifer]MRM84542.1 hypothetical protein [Riemerella anatipestifer]
MALENAVKNAIDKGVDFRTNIIRPFQIDFIKHLVSVSAVLLPLLSLVPLNLANERGVFHCLLCSLSLCILMGSAHLYIVLIQYRRMDKDLGSEIDRMLIFQDANRRETIGKYNRIMFLAEILCFLSFLISIGLIVYLVW